MESHATFFWNQISIGCFENGDRTIFKTEFSIILFFLALFYSTVWKFTQLDRFFYFLN